MNLVKSWKCIINQRGFINEVTSEKLKVVYAKSGDSYHLLLSSSTSEQAADGKIVSSEYTNESKATAYAMIWMANHPKGTL